MVCRSTWHFHKRLWKCPNPNEFRNNDVVERLPPDSDGLVLIPTSPPSRLSCNSRTLCLYNSLWYAIRIPANDVLEREIAHLLTRPVGRPPCKPIVLFAGFLYRAASWALPPGRGLS